jgi:hypothetical protein
MNPRRTVFALLILLVTIWAFVALISPTTAFRQQTVATSTDQ